MGGLPYLTKRSLMASRSKPSCAAQVHFLPQHCQVDVELRLRRLLFGPRDGMKRQSLHEDDRNHDCQQRCCNKGRDDAETAKAPQGARACQSSILRSDS
jgi:hypothetical protein